MLAASRRLLAILVLGAISDSAEAAPTTKGLPASMSRDASAVTGAFGGEAVLLPVGMGGASRPQGGMNCGANCGGGTSEGARGEMGGDCRDRHARADRPDAAQNSEKRDLAPGRCPDSK